MSTDALIYFSAHRRRIIEQIVEIIEDVKDINTELDTANEVQMSAFDAWIDLVTSDTIRLAVVGEYSNGKSSLLNALLETKILPTAIESTTAINTRIEGLHPDKGACIRLIYNQGEDQFLDFEEQTIERFGSEKIDTNLSSEDRKKRKKDIHSNKLDLIEIVVHSPHELFQNKVVLYDTPGIGSTSDLHDQITAKAIHKAHVALWLQKASQLGGTATEWNFFLERISKNFSNFITVVNKWDQVLEPPKDESLGSYEANNEAKLRIVRDKFEEIAGSAFSKDEIDVLLDDDHFITTSATWHQSDDPIQKKWSHIDELREMIVELCKAEEGEGIRTPLLNVIRRIEENLASIEEQRDNLSNDDSQQQLELKIERLKIEIKDFEQELQVKVIEAREQHTRNAEIHKNDIQHNIIDNIVQLRNIIESELTEEYVKEAVEQKQTSIGLPDSLQRRFEKTLKETSRKWNHEKSSIQQTLTQLRDGFQTDIKDMITDIQHQLGTADMSDVDFGFTPLGLNFEQIEQKQQDLEMLKKSMQDREDRVAELENKLEVKQNEQEDLQEDLDEAKRELNYLNNKIDSTPRPQPRVYQEHVPGKSGWRGRKPSTKTRYDDSAGIKWDGKVKKWEQKSKEEKEKYERLKAEGRLSKVELKRLDSERRKAQRVLDKGIAEKQRLQSVIEAQVAREIKRIYKRLHSQTIEMLDDKIHLLKEFVETSITAAFQSHLETMNAQVHEHFLNKTKEKRDDLQKVLGIREEGEEKVASYLLDLERLEGALKEAEEKANTLKDIEIPALFEKENG